MSGMIVTPIAHTTFYESSGMASMPESVKDTRFAGRDDMVCVFDDTRDIDLLHEFAGRACYQAWSMPNPKTATNEGYLENIVSQGHFSVLEHGSVTFYVEGVSRSLTHELVRHRHLSFSELSQRYVNIADARFVMPPALLEGVGAVDPDAAVAAQDMPMAEAVGEDVVDMYEGVVSALRDYGFTRKEAREAARSVMPNGVETRIVVTGNLRAWRDMLAKRWHVAADREIREFAGLVLSWLRDLAPNSVSGIPSVPYGYESEGV